MTGLLRYKLVSTNPDVCLCGPPPMIEAGQEWLVDQGVDEKLIHVEKIPAELIGATALEERHSACSLNCPVGRIRIIDKKQED